MVNHPWVHPESYRKEVPQGQYPMPDGQYWLMGKMGVITLSHDSLGTVLEYLHLNVMTSGGWFL